MTSAEMRSNPLFMRNTYQGHGKWDISLVRKQTVNTEGISLIAYSDTRNNDCKGNCKKGVQTVDKPGLCLMRKPGLWAKGGKIGQIQSGPSGLSTSFLPISSG